MSGINRIKLLVCLVTVISFFELGFGTTEAPSSSEETKKKQLTKMFRDLSIKVDDNETFLFDLLAQNKSYSSMTEGEETVSRFIRGDYENLGLIKNKINNLLKELEKSKDENVIYGYLTAYFTAKIVKVSDDGFGLSHDFVRLFHARDYLVNLIWLKTVQAKSLYAVKVEMFKRKMDEDFEKLKAHISAKELEYVKFSEVIDGQIKQIGGLPKQKEQEQQERSLELQYLDAISKFKNESIAKLYDGIKTDKDFYMSLVNDILTNIKEELEILKYAIQLMCSNVSARVRMGVAMTSFNQGVADFRSRINSKYEEKKTDLRSFYDDKAKALQQAKTDAAKKVEIAWAWTKGRPGAAGSKILQLISSVKTGVQTRWQSLKAAWEKYKKEPTPQEKESI